MSSKNHISRMGKVNALLYDAAEMQHIVVTQRAPHGLSFLPPLVQGRLQWPLL